MTRTPLKSSTAEFKKCDDIGVLIIIFGGTSGFLMGVWTSNIEMVIASTAFVLVAVRVMGRRWGGGSSTLVGLHEDISKMH